MSTRAPLVALVLLWGCASCCATTVRSGRPPEHVPAGYDERWHSQFFWGVVAAGNPYDLARICPNGWSQVTVARDPFTLVAGLATLFIYAPARVTIVCAVPSQRALPPPEGYAPNAPDMPPAPGLLESP